MRSRQGSCALGNSRSLLSTIMRAYQPLQWNELNQGLPTFFSQSQVKLKTKELEFVNEQLNLPLTVIGPLM